MRQSTNNLLAFQKKAVTRAIKDRKLLLNLPAGSGKTLIALEVAYQTESKRVLVVCPSFLRLHWQYEIKKWFRKAWMTNPIVYDTEQAKAYGLMNDLFAIVGYSFFEKKGNAQFLQKQHWDLVICDESHKLRKWESQRCRDVLLKIARGKKRLLFMSATPLVTSAADLHPTFAVMQPGKWGTYIEFKERYCIKKKDIFQKCGYRYTGINEKTGSELKERARSFVFTARKKVILSQLPPKRVIDLPVSVGKFEDYGEDVTDMIDRLADGEDEGEEVKTERERIGLAKVPAVIELIKTFDRKEQVVIFAWHRSVIHALFSELSTKARVIIGGMTEDKRMRRVALFTEGKFRYLICSIGAGGLGLNLQCASIAVFAELPYSYAEFEQCADRTHRLGSKKPVRIYKVFAVDSLDEYISEMIDTKQQAAETAGVAT